ncbi:uncharacterized protein LOC127101820 [Lathyrus oleraceus]|uniref:uncharacterized protein LOC127101820 n=1 Tax=Pisum sativum TaxID=3888 RepID=UPI0021D1EC4D|nr:uncharacterized protein LOC127101820 [Pisum sativum]
MSQHQTTSTSKTTKSTQKVSAPSMDFHDDEILDVVPLSVIPCETLDLNHPMDASTSACPNQGNNSSIPSSSTHVTSSKEDIHHTDHVIRNLVTRILNEGHSMKRVSTPLSKMYPSPEGAQHSEKNNDSSKSEKDMAAEGLCSLGQTMSGKGKSMTSKTANASHSEKHDVANDVIDLEDDRSDEQEDSLLHHLKPMKKRKVREVSESEEDVEEDVPDISPVKKTIVRKSHVKVAAVHLDNISFHLEDGAAKWKFVIKRRVAVERELGKDAVEVKEVMNLIKTVGLMKTVAGFSQCYEGLVKEFITNISEDIADKNNKEFCKVFVRGKCITFSPTVINNFLGRRVEGASELEATDNKVCREITARQVKGWPIKKHLPSGKLTVNHVEDIVMTSVMEKPASKVGTITELKETCKELDEGIRFCSAVFMFCWFVSQLAYS